MCELERPLCINSIVEKYFEEAVQLLLKGYAGDQEGIAAAKGQTADEAKRHLDMKGCLSKFRVLHWVNKTTQSELIKTVLEFLDRCPDTPVNEACFIDFVETLTLDCKKVTGKKNLSLSSKALWCRYPSQVLIYDKNARLSLTVLCRLADTPVRRQGRAYADFVEGWNALYEPVAPMIAERLNDCGYPYAIRVFDKILWILGQDA